MKDKVYETMARALSLDAGELQEKMDDKDIWDSLTRVEVIFALEERFNVQYTEDELAAAVTPRSLCEITLSRVS